jgi:lipid II isoglutaminyl synthase (glutamine-hydrolysing)
MTPAPPQGMAEKASQALAVNLGKGARLLSRGLGHGGGTSLPGLLAEKVSPTLLSSLAASLPNGCVLITGTNGKTTTTRIVAEAMRRTGLSVVTNREGSNLVRGLNTELLSHTDPLGRLKVEENAIGIFEVDEAAFTTAVELMKPRLVVFTNLFRDQLDRYFEVDYLALLWSRALKELSPSTAVVLNADDPQVAYLGESLENPIVYYGLEDTRQGRIDLEHAADSRRCLRCSTDLRYNLAFYGHLGHYTCPGCGWRRPAPRIAAWKVELKGMEGSTVEASVPWGVQSFEIPFPGLYNVYNVLCAASAAFTLGVDSQAIDAAVRTAEGAFARLETFGVRGRKVCLSLVKNPSGFNESLRLVLTGDKPKGLLLALNDNIPDGRDVSWIWDVDFEKCNNRTSFIVATGLRAEDLAVRLKYAGLLGAPARRSAANGGNGSAPTFDLTVEKDIVQAFWQAIEKTPPGETLYILPTYTAMWTLREYLAREGYVEPFWRK